MVVLCLCWQCESAMAAPRIESVTTEIRSGAEIPAAVRERMAHSVDTIGEQLLAGKSLQEAEANRDSYGKLIQQIFDKVLVGYSVDSVVLEPAQEAKLYVQLQPWADTIRNVQVQINVSGMQPMVEPVVRQDVAGLDRVFEESLQGLPVAAVDWTNGLLKKRVNEFLQIHAPEFKADFDVEVAETTEVTVTLFPLLPVVRTVDLNMRSATIPNLGLLLKRDKMQQAADQLIGVPVNFAVRHQDVFNQQLAGVLNQDEDCRSWGIDTRVQISPGERLSIMSRSDAERYRVRLEGWADVAHSKGRYKDDTLGLRLHVGDMLTDRDEILCRLDFFPQHTRWGWQLGYRHSFTPATVLGLGYDMREHGLIAEAEQWLTPKWLLRYEYHGVEHSGQAALRYKLHDFLALEYALDKDDSWLRFIGYF